MKEMKRLSRETRVRYREHGYRFVQLQDPDDATLRSLVTTKSSTVVCVLYVVIQKPRDGVLSLNSPVVSGRLEIVHCVALRHQPNLHWLVCIVRHECRECYSPVDA